MVLLKIHAYRISFIARNVARILLGEANLHMLSYRGVTVIYSGSRFPCRVSRIDVNVHIIGDLMVNRYLIAVFTTG